MKPLAPNEAYTENITSVSGKRLGSFVGILSGSLFLVGIAAAVAMFVPSKVAGHLSWPLLLGAAVLFGAWMGFKFPRSLKRRLLRATENILAGTGRYATKPPDGAFTHSLGCSLLKGRIEVGGILYLGRRLATFVPHSMNLPAHRQPVHIAEEADCAVRTIRRPRLLLAWVTGVGVPDLVEIVSPQGTWRFNTPRPEQMASELRLLLGPISRP